MAEAVALDASIAGLLSLVLEVSRYVYAIKGSLGIAQQVFKR
jgi:hypothetical protein